MDTDSPICQRIWDTLPERGILPKALYQGLRSFDNQAIDGALAFMMRKRAVSKTFGSYIRNPGATWPMVDSAEPVAKTLPPVPLPATVPPAVSLALKADAGLILRNTSGLRAVLFDTIEDLRGGRIDVQKANAISKAADTILKTVDTQIAWERLRLDSKHDISLNALPLISAEGAA